MQIPLVDGEGGDGEITVAMPEGYLKYMRLQNDIFLVDSLRTEPSAGTVLPLVFDPTLIL